jgi:hypothetical protein
MRSSALYKLLVVLAVAACTLYATMLARVHRHQDPKETGTVQHDHFAKWNSAELHTPRGQNAEGERRRQEVRLAGPVRARNVDRRMAVARGASKGNDS